MTTFKGEGYKFPDEQEAATDDFEFEVVDDTPEADRGREPMQEPPEEVTEDELASYDEKVQKRIKKFSKGYHDERRAKEQATRDGREPPTAGAAGLGQQRVHRAGPSGRRERDGRRQTCVS